MAGRTAASQVGDRLLDEHGGGNFQTVVQGGGVNLVVGGMSADEADQRDATKATGSNI